MHPVGPTSNLFGPGTTDTFFVRFDQEKGASGESNKYILRATKT